MATVRDLIKGSLRLIGAVATGETPSAAEQSDALMVLNQMLDSWSTESLMIFTDTRETFPLVGGKQVYTMGPLGDFPTDRPIMITKALLQIPSSNPPFEVPIRVVDAIQWSEITVKGTTSSLPTRIYPEYTAPLAKLNLWPIPDTANNLVIYSNKVIGNFTNANLDVALPPGYLKAIRYNLALELAPEYGLEPSALVVNAAMESKENLKRINADVPLMHVDDALMGDSGAFNYLTGE